MSIILTYEKEEDIPRMIKLLNDQLIPVTNKIDKKIKVKKEGDECVHCGTKVLRQKTKRKAISKNQRYYYTSILKCPKCGSIYTLEEEKVFTTEKERRLGVRNKFNYEKPGASETRIITSILLKTSKSTWTFDKRGFGLWEKDEDKATMTYTTEYELSELCNSGISIEKLLLNREKEHIENLNNGRQGHLTGDSKGVEGIV